MGLKKAQGIFNIVLLAWVTYLSVIVFYDRPVKETMGVSHNCDTIFLKEEIKFDTMQANIQNMYKVCDSIGIKYPKIVISQAILESGHFKSDLFVKTNNPLGLYDSKSHKYYEFNHWTQSIQAYKDIVEYRYKDGENYYDFLNRIGYAEDPEYINKLKHIKNEYNL